MALRTPLVVGNWKMNGLKASTAEFGRIIEGYGPELRWKVQMAVCPPATLIQTFCVVALGTRIWIGAQDCNAKQSGAFTGDISAEMIADCGGGLVIVGHSERRTLYAETDAEARAKAEAARRAGLVAVLCIGETEAERQEGRAIAVIDSQLAGSVPDGATGSNLVVAYEPVWAIGSGRTPTSEEIAEVHNHIRKWLDRRFGAEGERIRVLYGGSVKPSNAAEILAIENVDGALVGGASLKAADFIAIASVYA